MDKLDEYYAKLGRDAELWVEDNCTINMQYTSARDIYSRCVGCSAELVCRLRKEAADK